MTSSKPAKAGRIGESAKKKAGKQMAAARLEASGHTAGLASGRGSESELDRPPEWQPRYPGSGRLEGKVAIVTGADSGIGRAVAALYAREGADVAIVYNSSGGDAKDTAAIVESEGRRAVLVKGDVGNPKHCERFVADTIKAFGRLDILVNNAGEQHPAKDIRDIDEKQLRRTFETNIFGMFHMVQEIGRAHV